MTHSACHGSINQLQLLLWSITECLCLISTPPGASNRHLSTLKKIKDDLPHFCTLFPLGLISVTPERYSGGGSGWWAAKPELVLVHSKRERERMKGCEGMQLFKQLFDLVVTAPSVTHSGSNSVEITQTFIPPDRRFSALCQPLYARMKDRASLNVYTISLDLNLMTSTCGKLNAHMQALFMKLVKYRLTTWKRRFWTSKSQRQDINPP